MFRLHLVVRPRDGVRDPQGDAVQETLTSMGFATCTVQGVGRYLRMDIAAQTESEARALTEDMCRRLLVNPNLETYDITLEPLS